MLKLEQFLVIVVKIYIFRNLYIEMNRIGTNFVAHLRILYKFHSAECEVKLGMLQLVRETFTQI